LPAEVRGSSADPEFRHERAVKAAAARHSLDARIEALVRSAPALTAEQAAKLRALLPAPGDQQPTASDRART